MKRKVDSKICYRELMLVRIGTEGTIENHLGAAHRMHVMHRLRRECPLKHQSIEFLFRTCRDLCCEMQMN